MKKKLLFRGPVALRKEPAFSSRIIVVMVDEFATIIESKAHWILVGIGKCPCGGFFQTGYVYRDYVDAKRKIE